MRVREIMTADPACCTPDQTARDAARVMREQDCGCVPVVDDIETRHVVGVVTDRDLTIRALADGKGPETPIRELMSSSTSCCTPEDDLRELERIMVERQVRRVPVVDGAGGLIGIVAQADVALSRADGALTDREIARVVECISQPVSRTSTVDARTY